jgi:hypothetical protein
MKCANLLTVALENVVPIKTPSKNFCFKCLQPLEHGSKYDLSSILTVARPHSYVPFPASSPHTGIESSVATFRHLIPPLRVSFRISVFTMSLWICRRKFSAVSQLCDLRSQTPSFSPKLAPGQHA